MHDDDAAGLPRRLRHGEHFAQHGLLFHRHVAILVRGRTAQERNVDGHRFEEQPFLAGQVDHFHEIRRRARALPRPLLSWIDERVQTGLGDKPRPAGRHVAHQLRQHALRQRVGLDPVFRSQPDQARGVDQRARNRSPEQSLVRQVTGAQRRPITYTDHTHRREPLRLAFGQEAPLDRRQQGFRHRVPAARPADQDRVAIRDELRRLVR